MRSVCEAYLVQALQQAGVVNVYTEPKDAAAHTVVPYAEVLWGDERLRFDGSLVAGYDGTDDQGRPVRILRRRIYQRTLPAEVKIVHREGQLAAVADAFVAGLARRIFDGRENAILISLSTGASEESASRLRGKEVTVFLITFEGGVYKEQTKQLFDLGTQVVIEFETGGI
ncbi:MAG: hypothetical protein AB1652_01010 [Bacillota bacterium]